MSWDRNLLIQEVVERVIDNLDGHHGTQAEYSSLWDIYSKYTDQDLVKAINKLRLDQEGKATIAQDGYIVHLEIKGES